MKDRNKVPQILRSAFVIVVSGVTLVATSAASTSRVVAASQPSGLASSGARPPAAQCDTPEFDQAEQRFAQLAASDRRESTPASRFELRSSAASYIAEAEKCYQTIQGVENSVLPDDPVITIDDGGLWASTGITPAFAYIGTKWGTGSPFSTPPATAGGTVTYSFMADGVDLSSDATSGAGSNVAIQSLPTYAPCFLTDIANAFAAWAAVADIHFNEVSDSGSPLDGPGAQGDIRIGAHTFDGLYGTLAHAYYPPPNGGSAAGDVHFDRQENWSCNTTGIDIGIVAMHEIGHSIGLAHENHVMPALMNPVYNPAVTALQPDDISGAAAIYGVPPVVMVMITGNAGSPAATLSFNDSSPHTVIADGSGTYTLPVPYNWSGTVTPSKPGIFFTPTHMTYSNLGADQASQDYLATRRADSDFDPDGISDPAYFHAATGLWGALKSGDSFSYLSPQYVTWGQTGDIVVPGDFDGDGLLDPTVRRPPSGGQSAAYMILQSSAGYDYGSALTVPAGWPGLGDTPVPGDYNGDGMSDPAIWRGNTGVWIIPLSPSFNNYQFYSWGASGDTPVGADMDGDGQTDIGYWRPSTGMWGFLLSMEGYSYSAPLFFNWGASGDIAIMADYDGDGKADPAVVIPPADGQSRAYRILRSSTWYDPSQTWTIPAGWPGLDDMPVALDFDGDGKADAGIWRGYTGVWIIPKSSTGNTSYVFAAWGVSSDQIVK